MCGGPSSQQNQIAQQQQQFYQTLQDSYKTNFAGQQNILTSLTNSFQPILAAGVNQYGFSPQEDAAMRTMATSGVAQNYSMASQAVKQALASQGGGNAFLPTGASTQLQQQAALSAAQQQSNEQLGITQAGYQTGRANYFAAAQGLGNTAQMYDPSGYAKNAISGGDSAYGSAKQNATQSAQMWESIGGAIGGLASTALGAATGGASTAATAATGSLKNSAGSMTEGGIPTYGS